MGACGCGHQGAGCSGVKMRQVEYTCLDLRPAKGITSETLCQDAGLVRTQVEGSLLLLLVFLLQIKRIVPFPQWPISDILMTFAFVPPSLIRSILYVRVRLERGRRHFWNKYLLPEEWP